MWNPESDPVEVPDALRRRLRWLVPWVFPLGMLGAGIVVLAAWLLLR